MRKTYDRGFKLNICKKINKKEVTVTEIANEYGISRPVISRWVSEYNRYGNKAFSGKGNRLPDKARLYALEKELEQLKEENEILKKFEMFVEQEKK